MNNFYVYEWIRLDTNEPFYVGKGHGRRWRRLNGRNPWFNNIVKSIPVAVNILHNNLDEETSFGLEIYYIWLYRDIIGYDLCNIADGGEGSSGWTWSDEGKQKLSIAMSGENNPMWHKNPWDYMTEEKKKEAREKMSKALKGKNKGKNPRDKMTEEVKAERDRKCSEAMKGKNTNPRSKETKEKISKTRIEKGIAKDEKHPNATSVICLTTKRIFLTIKEAQSFYNIKGLSDIGYCCKGWKLAKGKKRTVKSAGKYKGKPLKWKYIRWNHNKKYRIKE